MLVNDKRTARRVVQCARNSDSGVFASVTYDDSTLVTSADKVTVAHKKKQAPAQRDCSVHLVVLAGANVGCLYELPRQKTTLGRDESADLQIMDAGISRQHAVIEFIEEQGAYRLSDLGSRNGSRVNGHIVRESVTLRRGDKVQLGQRTVLRVSYSDELETQFARQMYQAVLRDGLTGVFNRRYLDERLESEVAFARRHSAPLSIIMFDIDHFKAINDEHGHPAGDAVLQHIASLIGRAVRSEDVLARYGGEEFAVICRDTDEAQAAVLAERMRHRLREQPCHSHDRRLAVTISLGVAELLAGDFANGQSLIGGADQALYRAKADGRDRSVRYSTIGLER